MTKFLSALLPLLLLMHDASASKTMVQIRRDPSRTATSTTLTWQPYSHGDDLSDGVKVGNFIVNADTSYPMYVCRLSIEGIMTIGQTIRNDDNKLVCVLAKKTSEQNNFNFEVLVNIMKGAKLEWYDWDKYKFHPIGAVSEESTGQIDSFYIARHKVEKSEENQQHTGPEYLVGRFDMKINLGKVYVVEQGSEKVCL